jgi:hypothetical protein
MTLGQGSEGNRWTTFRWRDITITTVEAIRMALMLQDRILDNVQARIKPVVTQPSEAVLASVVTKPVETIVPKSKRRKPGRYRDREARLAYLRAYMAKRRASGRNVGQTVGPDFGALT